MIDRPTGIWLIRAGFGLLTLVLILLLEWQRPELMVRLDEGLRDAFLRVTADERQEDRLVVVDINEATLSEIGTWPWPRQRVADLVEILFGTYGARSVGLDIVFPEAGDAEGDARLASLAAHAPLTLAQIFDYTARTPAIRQGEVSGGRPARQDASALLAYGYIANHSGLAGARCVGNIGYLPNADGVLRHTPALTLYRGQHYSHFASALLACAQAPGNESLREHPGSTSPDGGSNGLWRVPYTRAFSAYTVIPASEILREAAPPALIDGRHVLVGSSSLGLADKVSTPLAPLNSGVMVHAASLSGLLDLAEGRVHAPWSGRGLLVAWSVLSIALAVGLIARLSAWGGLMLLLGLVIGWLGAAFTGVARQAEWSVTAPLWGYFLLLVTAVPYEWLQAQRKSQRLLNTFSHYVAQPVLDEILRLDLQHSLEPTRLEVTVLIADMEGYTQATSSMSLEDAAALTKDFLGCLTRPVLNWQGTLDKYTGDGLVAFWGAPLPCPDQADRAVSATLDILAEVDALNARRKQHGAAPVRVRIGIESGPALVGDLGTPFRSTYTAVGDCINFASRLEAAVGDLPARVLIGPTANASIKQFNTYRVDTITLRSTVTSIEIFSVHRP